MGRTCRAVFYVLLVLYLLALALFAVGTWGLFGAEKDPLSGVFLIPLGWPWNRFVDVFPEASWPLLTALAPAVTLILVRLVCRALHGRVRT